MKPSEQELKPMVMPTAKPPKSTRVIKPGPALPYTMTPKEEELFKLDEYYQKLIISEREQFQKILNSKLNVQQRDLERKYQANLQKAQDFYHKAQKISTDRKSTKELINRLNARLKEADRKLTKGDLTRGKLQEEVGALNQAIQEVWEDN